MSSGRSGYFDLDMENLFGARSEEFENKMAEMLNFSFQTSFQPKPWRTLVLACLQFVSTRTKTQTKIRTICSTMNQDNMTQNELLDRFLFGMRQNEPVGVFKMVVQCSTQELLSLMYLRRCERKSSVIIICRCFVGGSHYQGVHITEKRHLHRPLNIMPNLNIEHRTLTKKQNKEKRLIHERIVSFRKLLLESFSRFVTIKPKKNKIICKQQMFIFTSPFL